MLHVCNGRAAERALRRADVGGQFLCWDDLLHDGPVPPEPNLAGVSRARAAWVSDCGWASRAAALARFADRDAVLRDAAGHTGIVFWASFELVDQLQMLQVLNWLATEAGPDTTMSLVHVGDYLGGGSTPARTLRTLCRNRRPVSETEKACASGIWGAFTGGEPERLARLAATVAGCFPFLPRALWRLLEELPDLHTGLARTEREILNAVSDKPRRPCDVFLQATRGEHPRFLGDAAFWVWTLRLARGSEPLLCDAGGGKLAAPEGTGRPACRLLRQRFALTDAGREVQAGRRDRMTLEPPQRWLGGLSIRDPQGWRWNASERRCCQPAGSAASAGHGDPASVGAPP